VSLPKKSKSIYLVQEIRSGSKFMRAVQSESATLD